MDVILRASCLFGLRFCRHPRCQTTLENSILKRGFCFRGFLPVFCQFLARNYNVKLLRILIIIQEIDLFLAILFKMSLRNLFIDAAEQQSILKNKKIVFLLFFKIDRYSRSAM